MKIGMKLGVSFGLIILLMVIIGGVGILQLKKVNTAYQSKVLVNNMIQVKAMDILANWLEVRRSEKDFIARQDMQYFERGNDFLALMQENIQTIRKVTLSDEILSTLTSLEGLNKKYATGFANLAELSKKRGFNENSGLQGNFRNAAHHIGSDMEAYDNEIMSETFLQARHYEKDFVINRDNREKAAGYIKKFKAAFADLQGIDKSKLSTGAKESMNASLADYQVAMEKLFTADSGGFTTEKYNVARDAAHDIEALLNERNIRSGALVYLDIRKDEKDYMLRGKDKYVSGVEDKIHLLGKKINDSGIPVEKKQRLTAEIRQYLADFKAMVIADTSITAQLKEIKGVADQAMDLADTAEAQAQQIAVATVGQTVAQSKRSTNIMGVVGLISAVIGIVLAVFLSRSISIPLGQTVEMIQALENGNLDQRLKLVRKDEIGILAKSMDAFADNLKYEVLAAFQKLADGDFTFKAQGLIKAPLAKANLALNELMEQIRCSGEQISSGSTQVSDSSQSLSQGATEQASSLEEITSSLTEMTALTRNSAENANRANQLSDKTKDAAGKGNQQMKAMVDAMAEINDSGRNISKIIKVIDEIAFQTNLLALNAAVEAARAGKHGKGFAVVAEEVRNLAARSAKAAKETAELIEGSVYKTENGSEIANQTAEALEEIVNSINEVTNLVDEIAISSNEQAQGISQINEGLAQIDQVTQQNTANAEESAAAAEELSSQSTQLMGMLAQFKLENEVSVNYGNTFAGQQQAQQHQIGTVPEEKPLMNGASLVSQQPYNPDNLISLDDQEFGKYSQGVPA